MNTKLSRRSALRTIAGASAAAAVASNLSHRLNAADSAAPKLKGRVNHSVCKWCYDKIPLEDFCRASKEIGLQSVELLEVKDFPTLKKYGLTCAVVSGVPGGITSGLNRVENHVHGTHAARRR
jgi:hydroxypyruvate isomerase